MCEVVVLFEGYSKELDDGKMDANCSCTLIKGSKLIIVDTMTAWDREKIIEGIYALREREREINFMFPPYCK